MKTETENRVRAHGLALLGIFPNAAERDPVNLCRMLRRREAQGAQLALDRCNTDISDSEVEERSGKILAGVDRILGFKASGVPVFLNGDPRGYALKIDDAWMKDHPSALHRDWGGYGIIAPDLSED